ncbi:MAG TPA: hypothetical protein VEI97_14505 [bacterium]|nr:hypothetical protein [bacterium]
MSWVDAERHRQFRRAADLEDTLRCSRGQVAQAEQRASRLRDGLQEAKARIRDQSRVLEDQRAQIDRLSAIAENYRLSSEEEGEVELDGPEAA